MQSPERDRIAAFLDGAVATGASSDEVAALVETTLRAIERALVPVVGQRGVAALYKRSLHLARSTHPRLPPSPPGSESGMAVAALTAALARQTSADAATAGAHLLQRFCALLTTLIGESLTERLLRPVWATFLSGPSARDTTS